MAKAHDSWHVLVLSTWMSSLLLWGGCGAPEPRAMPVVAHSRPLELPAPTAASPITANADPAPPPSSSPAAISPPREVRASDRSRPSLDFSPCTLGTQYSLSLALVLDRSGSMHGGQLDWARKAAQGALAKLAPTDHVALITFNNAPRELFALREVGDGQSARAALGKLTAGGGTDGFPALHMAYEALSQSPSQQRHILFFTDGLMPMQGMRELARHLRSCSFSLDTIGLGAGIDAPFLGELAALAGGRFTSVDNPVDLVAAFEKHARPRVVGSQGAAGNK